MREPMVLLAIAACGGVGAVLRYSISSWANQAFTSTTFPMGTFVVNVIGCCLLGALSQATELSPSISPGTKAAIGVGLLGAFTTFSTFGAETLDRLQQGNWQVALLNVLANVLLGVMAVWLGAEAIRRLFTI